LIVIGALLYRSAGTRKGGVVPKEARNSSLSNSFFLGNSWSIGALLDRVKSLGAAWGHGNKAVRNLVLVVVPWIIIIALMLNGYYNTGTELYCSGTPAVCTVRPIINNWIRLWNLQVTVFWISVEYFGFVGLVILFVRLNGVSRMKRDDALARQRIENSREN
jgi:hypothetical protein